jgi:NAD+ kinase
MPQPKIHFCHETGKDARQYSIELARHFMNSLGQCRSGKADILVGVGGDGTLLRTLRKTEAGQLVMGVTPEESTSRGFWTHRGIANADDLLLAIGESKNFPLHPLQAKVECGSGSGEISLKAFNEFAPMTTSAQAMHVRLSVHEFQSTAGPVEIMANGLVIATALGSTGTSRSNGGPVMDIRNTGMILTGEAVYKPNRGFSSWIASDETCFEIEFLSTEKRNLRLDYDGKHQKFSQKNPIRRMEVSKDRGHAVQLLRRENPMIRGFLAMMP